MPASRAVVLAGLCLVDVAACRATSAVVPPATAPVTAAPAPASHGGFEGVVGETLRRYCVGCHSGERKKGGLALDAFQSEDEALAQPALWREVADRLASHDMPPEGEPQPSDAERAALVRWTETTVRAALCRLPDPGFVAPRRLNRREYENTVRDLLGVNVALAADLPLDTAGAGFDNLADALTTSSLLVERWLAAADRALDAVFVDPSRVSRRKIRRPAAEVEVAQNARPMGDGRVVLAHWGSDDLGVTVDEPYEATWVMRARLGTWKDPPKPPQPGQAAPVPAPPHAPRVDVVVDGERVDGLTVDASARVLRTYEVRVRVPAGRHRLRLRVPNEQGLPPPPPPPPGLKPASQPGVKVVAEWFELEGPFDPPRNRSAAYERLVGTRPPERGTEPEAARALLAGFLTRAYRRAPTASDVDELVALARRAWARGEPYENGIRLALRAALIAPAFLFRTEFDAVHGRREGVMPLDDAALAARLSYFLWSTMPDGELQGEVARGTLRANLEHQVTRMLADPRASALVRDFGGQWLEYRAIDEVGPAFFLFKNWDEPLRAAMRRETELVLETFLREERSIVELLDADWTFVNERLARHYGLADVTGSAFRRVSLAATPRRGILTHGSILTITSNAMRTSPVKRGKWVLEALLDDPPPPPPPDVPSLPESTPGRKVAGSVRQQLEEHRKNPTCAGCHARMDPLGFGLEQFDAVGAFRQKDNGVPVDASGLLTSGGRFQGAAELAQLLARTRADAFRRSLASRLLTYGIGRGLRDRDDCAIDAIVATARSSGDSFAAFVRAVVRSDPFLHTRAEVLAEGARP